MEALPPPLVVDAPLPPPPPPVSPKKRAPRKPTASVPSTKQADKLKEQLELPMAEAVNQLIPTLAALFWKPVLTEDLLREDLAQQVLQMYRLVQGKRFLVHGLTDSTDALYTMSLPHERAAWVMQRMKKVYALPDATERPDEIEMLDEASMEVWAKKTRESYNAAGDKAKHRAQTLGYNAKGPSDAASSMLLVDKQVPAVYFWLNLVTLRGYVGKAENLVDRTQAHLKEVYGGKAPEEGLTTSLAHAVSTWGWPCFLVMPVKMGFAYSSHQNQVESFYIKQLDCLCPRGYNRKP